MRLRIFGDLCIKASKGEKVPFGRVMRHETEALTGVHITQEKTSWNLSC